MSEFVPLDSLNYAGFQVLYVFFTLLPETTIGSGRLLRQYLTALRYLLLYPALLRKGQIVVLLGRGRKSLPSSPALLPAREKGAREVL